MHGQSLSARYQLGHLSVKAAACNRLCLWSSTVNQPSIMLRSDKGESSYCPLCSGRLHEGSESVS